MPTFYNFTENGVVYNFDDVFVPSEYFQEGGLYVWGNASNGVLGNGSTSNTNFDIISTNVGIGLNWKTVDAAQRGSMAIKSDGTLWVWGTNNLGQLGLGYAGSTISTPTKIDNNTNWKSISYFSPSNAAEGEHAASIKQDGTLWMWGDNRWGQLGIVGMASTNTPTQVGSSSDWKIAKTEFQKTVAIKKDGTLWITGSNSLGLGVGIGSTNVFTKVGVRTDWNIVEPGAFHVYAITSDGSLWSWGRVEFIGVAPVPDEVTSPTKFGTSNTWKSISCRDYTLAIKTDGTLWAKGSNSYGQLGLGTLPSSNSDFTQVGSSTNWKSVKTTSGAIYDSTSIFTLAIKTDGTLWGTGNNTNRQLTTAVGSAGTTFFTQISTKTNWKEVACGKNHNLGITYEN